MFSRKMFVFLFFSVVFILFSRSGVFSDACFNIFQKGFQSFSTAFHSRSTQVVLSAREERTFIFCGIFIGFVLLKLVYRGFVISFPRNLDFYLTGTTPAISSRTRFFLQSIWKLHLLLFGLIWILHCWNSLKSCTVRISISVVMHKVRNRYNCRKVWYA